MTANTIDIKASYLKHLLRPIFPIVGKDGTLPILTAVRLQTRAGHLTAWATDRYRLAVSRIPFKPAPRFDALVFAADLRQLLRLFPVTKDVDPDLRLTVRDGRLVVELQGAINAVAAATIEFALCNGAFPDVEKILREALAATPSLAKPVGINPGYFRDFQPAERNKPVAIWTEGPNKPIVIAHDGFIGLLMPVRLAGETDAATTTAADWADILAEKPTRKRAAKKAAA